MVTSFATWRSATVTVTDMSMILPGSRLVFHIGTCSNSKIVFLSCPTIAANERHIGLELPSQLLFHDLY
jgi:hypothetical protein